MLTGFRKGAETPSKWLCSVYIGGDDFPIGYWSVGASSKEPACWCRSRERHRFDPWVGKIPWRRKWQPTPVFLLGETHGQRSLAGYSPWGCKESDTTERLNHHHTTNVNKYVQKSISGDMIKIRLETFDFTWKYQKRLDSKDDSWVLWDEWNVYCMNRQHILGRWIRLTSITKMPRTASCVLVAANSWAQHKPEREGRHYSKGEQG